MKLATLNGAQSPNFIADPRGLAWLLGLLLIPLALGALGYGMLEKSKKEIHVPSVSAPPSVSVPALPGVSVTAPTIAAPNLAALSFTRNGNDVTVSGSVDMPGKAKRAIGASNAADDEIEESVSSERGMQKVGSKWR